MYIRCSQEHLKFSGLSQILQVGLRMNLKILTRYHLLYNICSIKTLLRKSKVRIDQCMNANDSYPVGVLSKSSCKITTKINNISPEECEMLAIVC